jgi:hypothetical protein
LNTASGYRFHPQLRAFEHGPTQINQHTIQRRDLAQNAKREIACAATQIEECSLRPSMTRCRASNDIQNEGRIHRGLLPSLELGKALHISVKALPDLFGRGFFV